MAYGVSIRRTRGITRCTRGEEAGLPRDTRSPVGREDATHGGGARKSGASGLPRIQGGRDMRPRKAGSLQGAKLCPPNEEDTYDRPPQSEIRRANGSVRSTPTNVGSPRSSSTNTGDQNRYRNTPQQQEKLYQKQHGSPRNATEADTGPQRLTEKAQ